MKYAHYDENTGKLLGWYSKDVHREIPEPYIEVEDDVWQEALRNMYNYVDPETNTLSKKDFRSLEEVKESKLRELKLIRDNKTKEIIVELSSGERLNGDEESQTRMTRAIQAMEDGDTINWIDYDNNTITLTRDQLKEALYLAGKLQTEIYIQYNELRNQVLSSDNIEVVKGIMWE